MGSLMEIITQKKMYRRDVIGDVHAIIFERITDGTGESEKMQCERTDLVACRSVGGWISGVKGWIFRSERMDLQE